MENQHKSQAKLYKIIVEWKTRAVIEVYSSSLETAIKNLEAVYEPDDPTFKPGTLEVDIEGTEFFNKPF